MSTLRPAPCLVLLALAGAPVARAGAEVASDAVPVKDLKQLRALVADDPAFAALADDLARRRKRAAYVGWGSILGGFALTVAGAATIRDAPSPCASSVCLGKAGPATAPLMLSGVALAVGGGLVGYLLAPPRHAMLGIIDPWNRRHPDRRLALLDVPCAESEAHGCSERPMSMPPALASVARVHSLHGRQVSLGGIHFAEFATHNLERGVRRSRFVARGGRYESTLDHKFSFDVIGGARRTGVLCAESAQETGWRAKGFSVTGNLGPFDISYTRDTSFTVERMSHRFGCDVRDDDGGALHLEPSPGDAGGWIVVDPGGAPTSIHIAEYHDRIQERFWWESTDGYLVSDNAAAVALVDLTFAGRVALDATLSPDRRARVAAVVLALVLYADRGRSPRSDARDL